MIILGERLMEEALCEYLDPGRALKVLIAIYTK